MKTISSLEKEYRVDLAMTVMRIMIKEIPLKNLANYLVSDLSVEKEPAKELAKAMREKVFSGVADYLVPEHEKKVLDLDKDVDTLIKEIGLMLPSSDLVNRFKSILATYIKGIRNKIDTRATLGKDIAHGGLSLKSEEVDKVLKVADKKTFKNLEADFKATPPQGRLDRIVHQADNGVKLDEYDLKKALAEKKAPEKKEEKLDTSHALPVPEERKEKKLPVPEERKEKRLPAPSKSTTKSLPLEHRGEDTIDLGSETFKLSVAKPVLGVDKIREKISETKVEKKKDVEIPKKEIEKTEEPKAIHKIEKPKKKKFSLFGHSKKEEVKEDKKDIVIPKKEAILVPPVKKEEETKKEKKVKEVVKRDKIEVKEEKKVEVKKNVRPQAAPDFKQKMHDIKPVPKVMGPIEELQFLDLVNFRRLGKTPTEMVSKIFSKIKLLEGDGYDKMIAGVKAWRKSPVNRLYIRIGQEAINNGVSMKEAIEHRKNNDKDYLSLEEIEVIVGLNGKLVF